MIGISLLLTVMFKSHPGGLPRWPPVWLLDFGDFVCVSFVVDLCGVLHHVEILLVLTGLHAGLGRFALDFFQNIVSNAFKIMSGPHLGVEIWPFQSLVTLLARSLACSPLDYNCRFRPTLHPHLPNLIHFGLTFVELNSFWDYIYRTWSTFDLHLSSLTHSGLSFVELDSFWNTFFELDPFVTYSCRTWPFASNKSPSVTV